ncbi:MAG TPA: MFS transporter [Steroidobacter sp.]
MLTLFYTVSFMDRSILSILAEPIKVDLHLSDLQLGLLGGLAFALLYSVFGLPIARLAERFNRVTIMSSALALWSMLTVASGYATSFIQLFLARAGVGIGEAACTPCSHSLIADYFPPAQRASAIGIYAFGSPAGSLLGILVGAWVADRAGWQMAFVVAGVPGLALALLAQLTLREPVRGQYDRATSEVPPLSSVVKYLFRRRSFIHVLIGTSLSTLVSAAINAFLPPFLLRGPFELQLTGAGILTALLIGVSSMVGVLSGGLLADRLARKDVTLYVKLPALCFLLSGPLYCIAFLQSDLGSFVVMSATAQILSVIYIGPSFGVVHNMTGPRMRASAVAIMFLVLSIFGLGLGPVLAGMLSDAIGAASFTGAGAWTDCQGLLRDSDATLVSACDEASFYGLRAALSGMALIWIAAGVHYVWAARSLRADIARTGQY